MPAARSEVTPAGNNSEGDTMAGRTRLRMTIVATVLALTAFGAPTAAQAALPTLKGTTVLVGDESASVRVRVTEAAVIDLTPTASGGSAVGPAALQTEGGKGHVGFLLTEPGTVNGLFVMAVRTPRRQHDGSTTHWGVGQGQPAAEDRSLTTGTGPDGADRCTRCRVPAGEYDLHLITEGRDTKVTISLMSGAGGKRSLRPGKPTTAFGWAHDFKAPRGAADSQWVGGIMGQGIGWSHGRLEGVLLNTYEFSTDARTLAAGGRMQSCRQVRNDETCDGQRVFAGDKASVAGSGAQTGWGVQNVSTTVTYEVLGGADYQLRSGLLWVSVRPDGGSALTSGSMAGVPQPTLTQWQTPVR